MEIETRKTVDMLTQNGVSILTQKFIEIEDDGKMLQVGENHRRAYVNSADGRVEISQNEPDDIVAAVMAIWGDAPTVEETESEESEGLA